MPGIFIFTADTDEAKSAVQVSIEDKIPRERVIGNFSDTIVLADRGACAFTTKAAHAQAAGAIGVVAAWSR